MLEFLDKVVAAKLNMHQEERISLIRIFKIRDDEVSFRWDGGHFAKCTMSAKDISILHDYGFEPDDDTDWWDKVDLHFLKTYYPAMPVDPMPGDNGEFLSWISPDGEFYYAHFGDHSGTARAICATLYNSLPSSNEGVEHLIDLGWIQLHGKIIIGETINKAQMAQVEYINKKFKQDFKWYGLETV